VAALKDASAGRRQRSSNRAVFLGAQVALSMVLLAGCGALLSSFRHVRDIDPGFDPDGVVATAVDIRASRSAGDPEFWRRLVDSIRRLPHLESVSLASRLPLELGLVATSLAPEGFVPGDGRGWPSVEFAVVDADYFSTMRIPMLAGRDFDATDTSDAPAAAIVNDVLARQYWGAGTAIGRRLVTRDGGRLRVVGVVRHSKYLSLSESPKPYVYLPLRQGHADAMTIVARASGGESGLLLRAIADTVRRLEPEAPLYEMTTMARRVALSLAPARGGAIAVGAVAVMALLLTAVGLFGIVAQAVSRRTFEIGVRRALGAPDRSVVWLMVRDTMAPVGIGCGVGLASAIAVQPVLGAVLYDVERLDPLVVVMAPAVIGVVCAGAAWLPSRRAALISPAAALRRE
jgi:predicted permease